jgi:hypothetical protein
MSFTELSAAQLPDPIPTGWILQGQGTAVVLPTLESGASAQLTFPYDPTSIPSGYRAAIFQDGTWTELPTTVGGTSLSAQITASTGYAVLAVPSAGATYVSLAPARILDSRVGTGLSGKFSSGSPRQLQVTGVAGVPSNAIAVTGSLTVTNQTSPGFASLTTVSTPSPATSSLNFPLADNRASGVTAPLGSGGVIWITYVGSAGGATTDLLFDVTGYYVP